MELRIEELQNEIDSLKGKVESIELKNNRGRTEVKGAIESAKEMLFLTTQNNNEYTKDKYRIMKFLESHITKFAERGLSRCCITYDEIKNGIPFNDKISLMSALEDMVCIYEYVIELYDYGIVENFEIHLYWTLSRSGYNKKDMINNVLFKADKPFLPND